MDWAVWALIWRHCIVMFGALYLPLLNPAVLQKTEIEYVYYIHVDTNTPFYWKY